MILTSGQVVWTPVIGPSSLSVVLNRAFAEACIAHKLEDLPAFKRGVWKIMGEQTDMPSNFLDLYGESIFPKGFYAGSNGLWLTVDMATTQRSMRPVTYHGHNEELLVDQWWLLRAFQAWASGAIVMTEWK